ncbi:ABC transporter substrate-binding protein [Brevibacillus laterosporus]|uniref:ABC transporter substrate-binding protein n=1 Tax=Brevibacillus laterosporus TaxID=1465 RepID=UPI0009F3FC72|nr:ABC transporter substrate-binding protein [Brevibacillus laterosporus]
MKKWGLSILMCTVGLSGMLAGCTQQQAVGTTEQRTAASQEATAATQPVEIDFWYAVGGHNGEMVQKLVKEFNQTHKDIVVKPSYQGSYYENHTKVLSAVTAGNQPDVTMVEIASIGAFADARVLEDLGPYAAGEEKKYNPGLMGNSYWKEKLYAVPFNRSTPLLYLNRDLLKKEGLDPNGPKTWEELRQFSQKLTKKEGGKTKRYGFSTPIDIWFYEALVFESGGQILSEDGKSLMIHTEAGKAPLEFWMSMLQEGIMKAPPGEKYNAWDVAAQDFLNQQVGMIFTTTGELKGMREKAKFDVGTAFLPANKDFGVPAGGANLVILQKSSEKEKKAAWEFVKWITDTPQTSAWSAETGYMPVTSEAIQSDEMKKVYEQDPNFQVAVKQLEYGKPRPMVPGYKELQEVIMTEIQRVILGQASIDEALSKAVEKGQKLLKK